MKNFQRLNNLTGWAVFAVALVTYMATVERTASFWDCGEFIAASYKLMLPHPPGTPIFLLIGRMFSFLALGDVTRVAYWVNMVSVLASAFSILFLFWTITMLGRKILAKRAAELTQPETYLLLGAGAVGALAYTFSDTFWFSAVEAEVYAMSSFFTAIVVWAAFKWELIEDEAAANRWLIFIAYLVGLSIGIHLLNLVTLPALALLYYFKKYPKPTYRGGFAALGIGFVILGIINSGIITGLPSLAVSFELLFVNTFGLPYGSGAIFFTLAFLAAVVWGIRYSIQKQKTTLNVALLALAFILIGYGSYGVILIRANYNPPINENNPNDALNFAYYLKREQYGSRSLLYGQVYTAQLERAEKGAPLYKRQGGKYVVYDYKPEYVWSKGGEMLFSRVWSTLPGHPQLYQQMLGIPEGRKPTFGENLRFFFTYQMGHMYMRYFLWNFAGRESDYEGAGSLPKFRGGEPSELIQNNKAHDNFYFLPLLLGLLGFFLQYKRGEKDFLVNVLMFLLTGIALVVFLNSPPQEPRERDYIYVGSFYFFAIWIGLGVMQLAEILGKAVRNATTRSVVATALALGVPILMGAKSWDNHDRSNRYHSVDFAKNLLNSCAPNAILFTGGDNDTFPLWYVQEVEGFRTDVRVCNLSLLGTDWYIEQMKRKTYESEALPISLNRDQFLNGVNDQIPYFPKEEVSGGVDLKRYLEFIRDGRTEIQARLQNGDAINTLPTSRFYLNVNVEQVKRAGWIPKQYEGLVQDTLEWNYGESDIYKPELIQLDIIANNDWKRPIYFASTLGTSSFLNLKPYFQLEGYAYRLMPFRVESVEELAQNGESDGFVNSDLMYQNMMAKMAWREMNNPNSYYDDTYRGAPVVSARIAFFRLASQLLQENKPERAREVLNRSLTVLPDKSVPYDQISVSYIGPLLLVNEKQKGLDMAATLMRRLDSQVQAGFNDPTADARDLNTAWYQMHLVVSQLKRYGEGTLAAKYQQQIQQTGQKAAQEGVQLQDFSAMLAG
jgi:hypothetical protein